jgi:hypothetical protein
MAVAERTAPPPEPVLPPEPLYRRRELHLLLGVVVASLTVAFGAARATDGARSVLDARLLQAGAGADAAVVGVESEQLGLARAVAFTQGVAQDLAARDGVALNRIVAPLQANSAVPMVDVVEPDGNVLVAVRAKGAPTPQATRKGLPALAWALAHARGPRGGRLSQVAILPGGATLVTVSPVLEGTTPVGAVLAMTPLSSVLGRLSQEVGADLTAYDAQGDPLDTTADFHPRSLDPAVAQSVLGGGAVVTRYAYGDHREKLGRLIVDHTAEAVLGASLPDDSSSVGRTVAIYAVIGLLCTVLILATFWTRFVHRRRP